MIRFIKFTVGFIILFISIVLIMIVISSAYVKNKGFSNYTTESNTLWLPENGNYDLLFMGISHARNFSRHKNHLRIEEILDSKIANIAQGNGMCGPNEQLFYLDYFYFRSNKASQVIYFLSPPLLFSETLPLSTNTFKYEVFNWSFLKRYISFSGENKTERILYYLQRKLHPKWLIENPYTSESEQTKLDSLDSKAVKRGQNLAYSGSKLNYQRFKESTKIVEETVKLAQLNNSKIIFIIPPALFGKWRGHNETFNFANSMKKKYSNVKVFDGSEAVLKSEFYFDSHHLNTAGVVYFTDTYIKSLIK